MTFNAFLKVLALYYRGSKNAEVFTRSVFENIMVSGTESLLPDDMSNYGKIFSGKGNAITKSIAAEALSSLDKNRFFEFLNKPTSDSTDKVKASFGLDEEISVDALFEWIYEQFVGYLRSAAEKGKKGKAKETSTELSIDKLHEVHTSVEIRMDYISKESIRAASKKDYMESRSPGSRFANLNILSNLLPYGYVITDMVGYAKTDEDTDSPLEHLFEKYADSHIALIGEGGIGKTTFLLKTMERIHGTAENMEKVTPIFVELNRCPPQIGEWFSKSRQKSDFITRYIAAQSGLYSMEDVPPQVLADINNEFKKPRKDGAPGYLLLFDGINEVSRGFAKGEKSTIRELLNIEIKALMTYPNVRIVTASRKSELAFFSGDVKNIELTGVKNNEIIEHLQNNNYSEKIINSIVASRKLMDCLRVPLFLCMFTASDKDIEKKPLTRGEILNGFFNKSHGIYFEKGVLERTLNPSSYDKTQAQFIIDFVLPYIGFSMEYEDLFFMNRGEILSEIKKFLSTKTMYDYEVTFWNKAVTVFFEYEKEQQTLNAIRKSLLSSGADAILEFIVNTMGIMYRDNEGYYNFIHHHIRDYFAGLYEIQYMKMAAAYYSAYSSGGKSEMITGAYNSLSLLWGSIWSESKRTFIGEILGEHRNAPILTDSGTWKPALILFPEQTLLKTIMDIFVNVDESTYKGMVNIVATFKDVRRNLAGIDFSGLDLTECRFHGVNCSMGRNESRLSAVFTDTEISASTFEMEGHLGEILEFTYSDMGEFLFTNSTDNTVKMWETDTGRCLKTIKLTNNELSEATFFEANLVVQAPDNSAFLTCGYSADDDSDKLICFLQEYSWIEELPPILYKTSNKHHEINSMCFSDYGYYRIAVFDRNHLYVYERDVVSPIYNVKFESAEYVVHATMIGDTDVLLYFIAGSELNRTTNSENATEEVVYKIALFNIKSGVIENLYTYSIFINAEEDGEIEASYSPVFCFDGNSENMVFEANKKLKRLSLKTKKVTGLPCKYSDPNHMSFAGNMLLLMDADMCVAYNIRKRKVEKTYSYGDLSFQIPGIHGKDRLLMFDDYLNSYEWDLVTNDVLLKYRYSRRTLTGVYEKKHSNELIVTFDNDSLWVIDKNSGALLDALCYTEKDARSGLALYSAVHDCMIFLYVNYFYEYIRCYDLFTGKHRHAYFDLVEERRINFLFTSNDESCLFCVFEKKIIEIDLYTLDSIIVYLAKDNEIIQDAFYDAEGDIVGVVVEFITDANAETPEIRLPHVFEMEKMFADSYRLASWYQLPYVNTSILEKLSTFRNEAYKHPNSFEERVRHGRTYFINSGLFLHTDTDITEALTIEKHIFDENENLIKKSTTNLTPGRVNYILGDLPAILAQLESGNLHAKEGIASDSFPVAQILCVSEKYNAIVAIANGHIILYNRNDDGFVKSGQVAIENIIESESDISGAEIGKDGIIYYWTASEKLYSYNMQANEHILYEYYIPGLAVKGCDFSGATMNDSVREMLMRHGGIF